jgi:preprotein translocase subunit Sec63
MSESEEEVTLYEVLGIPSDAQPSTIKKMYRTLAASIILTIRRPATRRSSRKSRML